MKIRFYIDPEADLPHIYNHDVRENEVEDVLLKPGEDRSGKENPELQLVRQGMADTLKLFMFRIQSLIVYL